MMMSRQASSVYCNSRYRLRRTRRILMKHFLLVLTVLFFAVSFSPLRAQVGNNNPAGQSGMFNGQVGACGYDPFTGNATRTITDIAVAGSVGAYPLALVRSANSRA